MVISRRTIAAILVEIVIIARRSLWKGQFQTPKSKCSFRKIDIPEMLIHELKKWKLTCPINEHDLVFPVRRGSYHSMITL